MEECICINGKFLSKREAVIPVTDRGFLYGYGLFETMRVLSGRPVFLQEHLKRLEDSAEKLGLHPPEEAEIKAMSMDTINLNKLTDGSLRVTVSAGPHPDSNEEGLRQNIVVTVKHGTPYLEKHYRKGFRAGFLKIRRNENSPFVRLKTLNYLENIIGRREASRHGWDEGLFLNNAGCLCEGTVSNLFLVRNKEIYTPDKYAGLLPGIIRQKVIEIASSEYGPVKECNLEPGDIFAAEEAFLTNSLMGIMPLVRSDGQIIGSGSPGPVTQILMSNYNEFLKAFE